MKPYRVLSGVFAAILGISYIYWAVTCNDADVCALVAAGICMLLVALAGILVMPSFYRFVSGGFSQREFDYTLRESRRASLHPWIKVALIVLASRIAIYIIAYILDLVTYGYNDGFFERMSSIWLRSDAPHYIGIARNWYVTEGDPRLHIVFFPLYPLLIKLVSLISDNAFSASLIASTLCCCGAGVLLYELALLDMHRNAALRTVKYMCILPAALFFNAPMSESLFLLLSVACLYFSRRRKFVWAMAFGALAAFTRSLGLILIVPMGMECAAEICERYKAGENTREQLVRMILPRALLTLGIALGFAGYVYINYAVTGEPFKFLQYQREHWGQRLGFFFNTAAYQSQYFLKAFADNDQRMAFGLWLPNMIALAAVPTLMIFSRKKIRPTYIIYALAYYVIAAGATWLLSAPRYMCAIAALPMALGALTRKTLSDVIVTVLCIATLIAYLWAFVAGWPVY